LLALFVLPVLAQPSSPRWTGQTTWGCESSGGTHTASAQVQWTDVGAAKYQVASAALSSISWSYSPSGTDGFSLAGTPFRVTSPVTWSDATGRQHKFTITNNTVTALFVRGVDSGNNAGPSSWWKLVRKVSCPSP